MALGREVHDRVVAGHGLFERARIADVALDELEPRIVVDVAQRRQVAGIRERVVHRDLVVGVGEHVADEVRADEAGAAGDEQLHDRTGENAGRISFGISARRGLELSRPDNVGAPVRPQSAATSGSSHATPSSSFGS